MSRPAVAVFIRILIGLLCLQALWALTNPIFASPDETAHIARAQSFATLDFTEPYTTDGVPIGQVDCYRFFSHNPADCMDVTWLADGTQVDVATDGYPPLLHIVAGIPHTVTSGLTGVYVMRLWLALATAALFAWAGVLTYRLGRWAFTGLLFAVTPMVAFVSSTVNPSGITAASAALLVATWLSGRERNRLTRRDLVAYAVGALGLIATRRDGVFWLGALTVIALVHHGAPKRLLSAVTRRGSSRLRVVLPAVIVVVVAAGALTLPWMWRFVDRRSSADRSIWHGIKTLRFYFDQIIGYFGWLDTPMPSETMMLAYLAIGALIYLGVASGDRADRRALAVTVGLMVAVPVAFAAVRFPYFQGRYMLPLWVALAMLAGAAVQRSTIRSVSPLPLGLMWVVVHVWALVTNLKRYAVGTDGEWGQILESNTWHPPMMSNLVALTLIGVLGVGIAVSVVGTLRGTERG